VTGVVGVGAPTWAPPAGRVPKGLNHRSAATRQVAPTFAPPAGRVPKGLFARDRSPAATRQVAPTYFTASSCSNIAPISGLDINIFQHNPLR
jgi:hypothetical protein